MWTCQAGHFFYTKIIQFSWSWKWNMLESFFRKPVGNLNGMFGFVWQDWSVCRWAALQCKGWCEFLRQELKPHTGIARPVACHGCRNLFPYFTRRHGAIFQHFILFEGLCGMFLTCGSISPTCVALFISSYLYLSVIVISNKCIIMIAAIDA